MASTSFPHSGPRDYTRGAPAQAECARELTHDIAEYVTEYARQNPGYTALWCLGVGFVLGWKLKPW
jgi:hypothetical protein